MVDTRNTTIRSARDTIANSSGLVQINFLKTIEKLLERIMHFEKQRTDSMKQELLLLENGRLHIHQTANVVIFCCKPLNSAKAFGITKEPARVHRLARRAYLEDCIEASELYMKKLQRIIDASDIAAKESRMMSRLKRYANAGLDLSRILFTEEQNEWINQAYTPNPFHQENLNYKTRSKILVRSKSEAMIGSYFEEIGIPYRSDDLVNIISDSRGDGPYRDNYFADFKVPNLLGGITIHEHFGAFQIDNYSKNALQRLHDYHSFKVIELPGRQVQSEEFTWSFESDLMQSSNLENLVFRILLPGIYF